MSSSVASSPASYGPQIHKTFTFDEAGRLLKDAIYDPFGGAKHLTSISAKLCHFTIKYASKSGSAEAQVLCVFLQVFGDVNKEVNDYIKLFSFADFHCKGKYPKFSKLPKDLNNAPGFSKKTVVILSLALATLKMVEVTRKVGNWVFKKKIVVLTASHATVFANATGILGVSITSIMLIRTVVKRVFAQDYSDLDNYDTNGRNYILYTEMAMAVLYTGAAVGGLFFSAHIPPALITAAATAGFAIEVFDYFLRLDGEEKKRQTDLYTSIGIIDILERNLELQKHLSRPSSPAEYSEEDRKSGHEIVEFYNQIASYKELFRNAKIATHKKEKDRTEADKKHDTELQNYINILESISNNTNLNSPNVDGETQKSITAIKTATQKLTTKEFYGRQRVNLFKNYQAFGTRADKQCTRLLSVYFPDIDANSTNGRIQKYLRYARNQPELHPSPDDNDGYEGSRTRTGEFL
ncbi:hypothetical protein SCG7109_AP_00180 [Chlamydiales bacterium SCGC AG-110-M15]|nr:hypothetical protein SCG7109_AP_00180 [Chlamydiales bacterium SCGC AG-110-M15]